MSWSRCTVSMTMNLADSLSNLTSLGNLRQFNSKVVMNFQLFVCLVLLSLCIVSAASDSCCHGHNMETCDVFGFNSSLCSFTTKDHDGHGGCPRHFERLDGVPNGMDVVQFHYQLTSCTVKEDDPQGNCLAKSGLKMITLNVTFTLDGPDLKGILFGLETNVGLVNNQHFCHYIIIEGELDESHVKANQKRKLLYYDGFDEEIHPGSSYKVTYRTLPAPQESDFDVVSSKVLRVPDCNDLPNSETIYFCSLPSPGKWNSSIFTTIFKDEDGSYSVDVTFTTVNDSLLNLYVIGLSSSPDPINLLQDTVINNESEWRWDDELGSLTISVTYTNVSIGENYFQAVPKYPVCEDPHWGLEKCPKVRKKIVVGSELGTVEPSSPTTLSSKPSSSLSHSTLSSTLTISDDTVAPSPESWRSLIISLVSLACLLLGCSVVFFCYWYSWSKYVCKYGGTPDDLETVKSGRLFKDEPRPLTPGPIIGKYRVIHPEDDATTTPEIDRMTLTTVTSNREQDFKDLITPGRNEYCLLQNDPLLSTLDEGYPETPPVMEHEEYEDTWHPKMEPLRQDSGFSDLTHLAREDHNQALDYSDGGKKGPISRFLSHGQPHGTNHSEAGLVSVPYIIQRETVI